MKAILEMYQNLYSEKVEQLKEAVANPAIPGEDEFEIIQQQDLQRLIVEDNYDFMDRNLNFDEAPLEYEQMTIPDEQPLRPFFFMRLIQKSISEGAFLTEHLYIPQGVWT